MRKSATVWIGLVLAVPLVLSACGGSQPERVTMAERTPLPSAEFRTEAEQFAALQSAALAADYPAFAQALGARDTDAVVAKLGEAFGGEAFDVYTDRAVTSGNGHRRLVELRGTGDRLYLFVRLDRVPGGWNVAGYELGRDRDAFARRV